MINVHNKYMMIGAKPSNTNAIGCFLQAITKVVHIFPESIQILKQLHAFI